MVAENAMAAIRAAIGGRLWQTPPEIATACGVGVSTVYAWIDEGLVESPNVTPGKRPQYKIYSPSVIKLYERRLGITTP